MSIYVVNDFLHRNSNSLTLDLLIEQPTLGLLAQYLEEEYITLMKILFLSSPLQFSCAMFTLCMYSSSSTLHLEL